MNVALPVAVGSDVHRTDPCLALAETGRIGSRTGEEINAIRFVGNAVKAALDYSCAVSKSKNGIILELVRAVIAISWIVGRDTKPIFAAAVEIDAEVVIGEDRIGVEVVSGGGAIENIDAGEKSSAVPLKAIVFPAPDAELPIVLFFAPLKRATPEKAFPIPAVAAALRPIRLPFTVFSEVPVPLSAIP